MVPSGARLGGMVGLMVYTPTALLALSAQLLRGAPEFCVVPSGAHLGGRTGFRVCTPAALPALGDAYAARRARAWLVPSGAPWVAR